MKQTRIFKKALLLLTLILGVSEAWAEDVTRTWDFTNSSQWSTIAAGSGTVYYNTDGSDSDVDGFNASTAVCMQVTAAFTYATDKYDFGGGATKTDGGNPDVDYMSVQVPAGYALKVTGALQGGTNYSNSFCIWAKGNVQQGTTSTAPIEQTFVNSGASTVTAYVYTPSTTIKRRLYVYSITLTNKMSDITTDAIISAPSYWSFDELDAGKEIETTTNYHGMYLRSTSSRKLTIEASTESGTFSDGSKWSVMNVGRNVAAPIFDATGMTASQNVQSKKTDACFGLNVEVPGTLYVIMKCSSNASGRYMYLKFNGETVQEIPASKSPTELKYTAKVPGTYFFNANIASYLIAVRFVPDIKEYSILAPSDCFSFCSPLNLDLSKTELRAYVADSINGNTVSMKRIDNVPGQTGVVMRGVAGQTYTLPVMATAGTISTNLLRGAASIQKTQGEEVEVTSVSYHHNSDEFAAELVRRWQEYWQERPGQGTRVNAGGVKIIFSDSQTHSRGVENFRTSGIVDPMRIPKDAFYVHQTMWDGWVDDLKPHTYICGHWNYESDEIIPRIYVVSTSPAVELLLSDETVLKPTSKSGDFLYTFENVPYLAGYLTAIGYDEQHKEQSRYTLETTGEASKLVLKVMQHPTGWKADGADLALVDVEVVDDEGKRCPLDNRDVTFTLEGPAEWLGGVAHGSTKALGARWTNDNYVRATTLPVQSGINRVMLRSKPEAGTVTLTASAEGLSPVSIDVTTLPIETVGGLSTFVPSDGLQPVLDRGESPSEPSFVQKLTAVGIKSVKAGSGEDGTKCVDNSERTTWSSGDILSESWITFTFDEAVQIKEVSAKMGEFRTTSYPIAIYAGDTEVWRGYTPKTLGYVRMQLNDGPASDTYTIRMLGESTTGDAFSDIIEVDGSTVSSSSNSNVLRITEIEFLKAINQ